MGNVMPEREAELAAISAASIAHLSSEPRGFARERKTSRSLLVLIEDFGNLSGGQFRQKYPDCGVHEGYGYVQRKARAVLSRRPNQ